MRPLNLAPVLALAVALSACGGVPTNRSMNSVHQPVVETSDYTLDVTADAAGLAYGEQGRLAAWFEAMGLKYGDKVSLDDPSASPATRGVVEALAARYGLTLSAAAPQTAGYVTLGAVRVIVTRSRASVPGCPEWKTDSDFNPNSGLSSNYGCAVNSNLAAMVANPEDLLHGSQEAGSTAAATSNKAIAAYREAKSTGKGNTVSDAGSKDN
jgi:pilus assembly protein CpaD